MIDNLRRLARLSNIFDPTQQEPQPMDEIPRPSVTPDMMPPIPMMPPQPLMMGQEEPVFDHTAEDRVNAMINGMPQRKPPSALDRIGAMVTGVGYGPEAGHKFLDRHHDQDMADWKAKFDPSMQAANLERYGNANERLILGQRETARKNREVEVDRDARLEEDKRKNIANENTRNVRAKAYDYRARNPNHIIKEDENGFLLGIDPITQKSAYILNDLGQKIKSSDMPEEDKVNLQIKGAKELAHIRGTEARETKETKSGSTGNSDTPNQQKIAQYLKAREYYNLHPEIQKFIHLGDPGTNDFNLVGPSQNAVQKALGISSGPTAEQFEAMKTAIYGPGGAPITEEENKFTPDKSAAPPVKPSKLAAATKAPKGRVNIYKNGELVGSIPDTPAQRQKAKDAQYEVK